MKFALSAALLSLAGLATAGSILPRDTVACSEADIFGTLNISNTNGATSYRPGDIIRVYVDFSCPLKSGITPNLLYYQIIPRVPINGYRKTFVLAATTLPDGGTSQNITMQIPAKYIFPNGTLYDFVLTEYSYTENSNGTRNTLTNNLTLPITMVTSTAADNVGNPGR